MDPSPRNRRRPLAGLVAAALIAAPLTTAVAWQAELTEAFRDQFEPAFREANGVGFASFTCDLGEGDMPRSEFSCLAVDDDGDRFEYRVLVDNEAREVDFTVWQPIGQLDPEGLAWLLAPIERYLAAFSDEDWDALHGALAPVLQEEVDRPRLVAMVRPVRNRLGVIRDHEPSAYASKTEGVHLLEVAIEAENGPAVGRFRVQANADGEAGITAFLVVPPPGTPLFSAMLEDTGRAALEGLGLAVVSVSAPFGELGYVGAAVEGEVAVRGGDDVPVRVHQKSTLNDFATNDFEFQVLDAAWLIDRHLRGLGELPERVECPRQVVADGEQMTCVVTTSEGRLAHYAITRRGGDHRLRPVSDNYAD